MQILNRYTENEVASKYINTKINKIIPSKVLLETNRNLILDYTEKNNLVYPSDSTLTNETFLFCNQKYNDNFVVTPIIPREIYKIYIKHFFNFIKKNKIKIVTGKILNYSRNKNVLYVGINGLVIPISKENLTYHANKFYNYKKWKKGYSFYKLVKLNFFCENIQNNPENIEVKLSRKKFLKLLKKKNATI